MSLQYREAVEWIHARLRLGIKPGLSRMEWLLEKLGNPHKSIKAIHIGGTNGKGSTVTYLRNILSEEGYTVGTFTSPYFEQFNERISIDGNPATDDEITELVAIIKLLAEELEKTELGGPSEFEVITAMSFYYFAKIHPVDIVLYEVGLGGRLDSTNVVQPILSIITNVGMDHTQFLGDRIEDIAFEKAGIIKEKVPVISGVDQNEAVAVIERKSNENQSPLHLLHKNFFVEHVKSTESGEVFNYKSESLHRSFEILMVGEHQTRNAALAIRGVELLNRLDLLNVKEDSIETGLKKAYWPGRMEKLSHIPNIYIDGAHNKEGIQALTKTIQSRFSNHNVSVLFTALNDKELRPMVEELEHVASKMVFTSFNYPRASKAKELYDLCTIQEKQIADHWIDYVAQYLDHAEPNSVLIITGSLYFISEAKPRVVELLENKKNKGDRPGRV